MKCTDNISKAVEFERNSRRGSEYYYLGNKLVKTSRGKCLGIIRQGNLLPEKHK